MITYDFEFQQSELKKLENLVAHIQYEVTDKALQSAAKPVIAKARAIAPDSIKSKSRLKWGRNKTEHFDPTRWAIHSSGQHIGRKTFKTKWGAMVFVGAQYSEGIKQQYNHPLSEKRTHYYWGKPGQVINAISRSGRRYTYARKASRSGETWHFPKEQWFMKKAYDETIPQQISRAVATIEQELERIKV
jgi:hypothetical protein